MDKQTIDLAFQIIKLRASLLDLECMIINSDISSIDKSKYCTAVSNFYNLDFIREAVTWSCDDYYSSLADNFRGFEVKPK